jgi:glutaredoxin
MVGPMRNGLRQRLYDTLTSTRGDGLPGVRLGKSVARLANELLGGPLAPSVGAESGATAGQPAPTATPRRREPAPVMLYVEWDSPRRDEVERILKEGGVAYKVLEIDDDEATKSFIRREAKREPPALFIAAEAVGWVDELEALAASGELKKRVFGG